MRTPESCIGCPLGDPLTTIDTGVNSRNKNSERLVVILVKILVVILILNVIPRKVESWHSQLLTV
jgi:hypothetical protein